MSWGEAARTGWKWGKPGRSGWARTYSRVVPGASGRVLVVDDNKVIRQLIRVNLELEGFEVVTAADGAECLDVVHQVRPDVVTLDVVMPRLDGLRTAARLRADPRTRASARSRSSAPVRSTRSRPGSTSVSTRSSPSPSSPPSWSVLVRQLMRARARRRPPRGPRTTLGRAGAGETERPDAPAAQPARPPARPAPPSARPRSLRRPSTYPDPSRNRFAYPPPSSPTLVP